MATNYSFSKVKHIQAILCTGASYFTASGRCLPKWIYTSSHVVRCLTPRPTLQLTLPLNANMLTFSRKYLNFGHARGLVKMSAGFSSPGQCDTPISFDAMQFRRKWYRMSMCLACPWVPPLRVSAMADWLSILNGVGSFWENSSSLRTILPPLGQGLIYQTAVLLTRADTSDHW
jgi:hypothetical protein